MTVPPPAPTPEPPPVMQLAQMITGRWLSQMITVAARLGIADLVEPGPQSPGELAAATNTHAPSLYRLLRALASAGIFAETKDGRFVQTPLSDYLRTDAVPSLRYNAIMVGDQWHTRSWEQLLYSIQTGKPAIEKVFGMPPFDYFQANPEPAANFNRAMTGMSQIESETVCDAYDFRGIHTLVDIAGGHGHLLATALHRSPGVEGILFDLPHVLAEAPAARHMANLNGRCRLVAGSFLESVPEGADAYMLKHIIHDWDDETCRRLLTNIRKAIAPGGKLIVIEYLVPPGNGPSFAKLMDMEMLLLPGGKERTEQEFTDLFASAGFDLARIVPTRGQICILEGKPSGQPARALP